MSVRCLPDAAIAVVIFAVWLHFAAPAIAQESPTPQAAPSAAPAASPVPLSSGSEEILKLSRAKIIDDVTIAFIQNGDRRYTPTASEIIYLRKEGVSDRVLTAMLDQQSRASSAQTPPQAIAPATEASASAPQYVAQPATTVVGETSPASTVYVAGSTPTYYSFYDPWPYWYDPWPYYYPYFSLGVSWGWGWGWGGCYNGYYGYYGHYAHDGHYGHDGQDGNHHSQPSHGGGQPPGGHSPNGGQPPNGNPPSHNGGSERGGQPGMYASAGRSPGGASQPRSDAIRAGGTAPTGRPTSNWSGNGNSSAVARSGQPNAVASRGSQAGGPTKSWSSGANNRIIAGSSSGQSGVQSSRAAYVSRGATTGSATARPTSVWNRQGAQVGNAYAGSPASSPQRIAVGSSSSYRVGGSSVSTGRPSPVSSYGGTMNSGGFRGGGRSYGGGSAPRMSAGGASQGGGGFHGGGGGGFHR